MTNIIELHTKAEQDDLLSERDRLHREYDKQLDAKINLLEQRLAVVPPTSKREAIYLVLGAVAAALVGAVIAYVQVWL